MATNPDPLAPLSADIDQLVTVLTSKLSDISTEVANLKAQVAAGNPITPAMIDALDQKVKSATGTVNAVATS